MPSVISVSPNTGPTAGGTAVTITGASFTSATAVTFGGTAASSFTVVSDTQITATTPAGSVGAADVAVTTAIGTGTGTGVYTYAAAPTVTSVSPNTGSTAGGTAVTITGTGFNGATAVSIGGTAASSFTVVSDTQITATTPAGSVGASDVAVTTPNGTGTGTGLFTFIEQTPEAAFKQYKDDIKRIIQDQAEKRLTTLMSDNGRMMQDARTRFIGFAGGGMQAGLTAEGFDAIAFDVDGTVDVEGGLEGIVAASSGEFLGQTGMVNGANWRVSGNFDVLLDDDQSLVAVDARLAREQFLTRNVLWGAFGGGQFSGSDIEDTFNGSETTWQLYGGTYAVGKLTSNLFADAYASLGYGWSDLSMENDVLSLDSNYGTFTWQVGGSLAGLIEMERFSLLPTVSLAYGNSNIGEIDFTARAYGLSDNVSLDADYVAMGVLRLTPEVRIPLGADATTEDGMVLGLLPSFICEQVVADDSETRCGWGAGVELMQAGTSGIGQFTGKLDFQQIGGISQIGGQLGYSIEF